MTLSFFYRQSALCSALITMVTTAIRDRHCIYIYMSELRTLVNREELNIMRN